MDGIENSNQHLTVKAVYDYKLIRNALDNSDQSAYAELLNRYKESVNFMMHKICNNKDDAEDLTIEAFGRAFKNLHQYVPNYAFSTWLFKIASNNAIDFIRKKNQKFNISLDNTFNSSDNYSLAPNLKTTNLDPEEQFIRKQKIETIRFFVDNLKPKYKIMIDYFYFQELSHEEISNRLKLPIGTIKAQLSRARDLLYNVLKDKTK